MGPFICHLSRGALQFLPLGQRLCNSLANFTSSSDHFGIPTVFDIFLDGFGGRLYCPRSAKPPRTVHFHSRAGHQCRAFADIHQLIEFFFAHGPVASRINHQICSVSGIIFRLYSAVGYGAMTAVGWPQMFAQFVEPDIH